LNFAIITAIVGFVTSALRIISPSLIGDESYIQMYSIINGSLLIGSISYGINNKLNISLLKNKEINCDVLSTLIFIICPVIYLHFLVGDYRVIHLIYLYLFTLIFGFHENMSSILVNKVKFKKYLGVELLYLLVFVVAFIIPNVLLMLMLFVLCCYFIFTEFKLTFSETQSKNKDKFGYALSAAVTYILPVFIANNVSISDGSEFLMNFSAINLVISLTIMVNTKLTLIRGKLFPKDIVIGSTLAILGCILFWNLNRNLNFSSIFDFDLILMFVVLLFMVSRIFHSASILFERFNLGGHHGLLNSQLFRFGVVCILFSIIGISNHSDYPYLYLAVIALINITSSIYLFSRRTGS